MSVEVVKKCRRCEEEKPLSAFYVDAKRPDGLYYMCKDCKREDDRTRRRDPVRGARGRETNKRWHLENRERSRLTRRRSMMKKRYGITLEDHDRMLQEQGGLCAICGTSDPSNGHPEWGETFCVDHDHTTGTVRGLLCHPCNRGLGQFHDSPELLTKALTYLARSGIVLQEV